MGTQVLRSAVLLGSLLTAVASGIGCSSAAPDEGSRTESAALSSLDHGHDVWFKNTYGGGWFLTTFLSQLAPADKRLPLGFDAVLALSRADRFAQYGVLNDPDCHEPGKGETVNPAHPHDVCIDPEATGIVGLRLEHDYNLATGEKDPSAPLQFGVACAACHAGFDPINVPRNPAEPTWANIHPTIGALRFRIGAFFGAKLDATSATDGPKKALFNSWNAGTVDTTTLFDDGINNPGVVTAFWSVPERPYFTNAQGTFHRSGQGGEDDIGGQTAATRVYSNVGMCYRECSLPAIMGNRPIDVPTCKATCTKFPPQQDLDDMQVFLNSIVAPKNPKAKSASDPWVRHGKDVFNATCASCHSGSIGSSDTVLHLSPNLFGIETDNNTIGTNDCRAQTTNWDYGKIWADFSSTDFKDRGFKGYRVLTLKGMWATAPYLHHNGIGTIDLQHVTVQQENDDFESSAYQLLTSPLFRSGTRIKTTTIQTPLGPIPDVPINTLPLLTGGKACELDELQGHAFGTALLPWDKQALVEYLRTL